VSNDTIAGAAGQTQQGGEALLASLRYRAAGLSVLPIKADGSKTPDLATWAEFQTRVATEAEVRRWHAGLRELGVGIVTDRASGNLGVLDFEFPDFFGRWADLLTAAAPDLCERLPIVRTPGKAAGDPGLHGYFRCVEPVAGRKVVTLTKEEALRRTGDKGRTTAVEIRGRGNQVLAPGCPASCHPSGRTYQHIAGPPIEETPVLSVDQFKLILRLAQATGDPDERARAKANPLAGNAANEGERPGDAFNRRATWEEILCPRGWAVWREMHGKTYWTRPGKDRDTSATTGYCRGEASGDLFYCFSSNAEPFEGGRAYSRFAAFALLNHAGDFVEAARDLASRGYGDARQNAQPKGDHAGGASFTDAPLPPTEPEWPEEMRAEAYHGLAGNVVDAIGPNSESDPVALLVSFLVGFGSVVGRAAWFEVESTRHHPNEFAVFVGRTGKARKGTSWGQIQRLLRLVDEPWTETRVPSGLVSGEGLIWGVRDPVMKRERVKDRGSVSYEEVEADPGITDKRLLVMEGEFAGVLKAVERQNSTLSPILRQAWDGSNLQTLAKNSPARATEPHVSVIGHITAEELRRCLSTTEMANGLGNRHLWFCVNRSKLLPDGGSVNDNLIAEIARSTRNAVVVATGRGRLSRDDEAGELWRSHYERLSEGLPGLSGALMGRAEAHVLRLALIYALLDQAKVVKAAHLKAAIAVWDYAADSVRYVFGAAIGDPLADEILELLKVRPEGVTRTEIRDHFHRNQKADQILRSLATLEKLRLAKREMRATGGRDAEHWTAVRRT
jgi:hypothetical protein